MTRAGPYPAAQHPIYVIEDYTRHIIAVTDPQWMRDI